MVRSLAGLLHKDKTLFAIDCVKIKDDVDAMVDSHDDWNEDTGT
jgi:hypothetical protein